MIKIVDGNILDTKCDAILHQVNCKGVMGAGLAKQIREKYPIVYEWYKDWCSKFSSVDALTKKNRMLGCVQIVPRYENNNGVIANLFAQDGYGHGRCYTDYTALRDCLMQINNSFRGQTVALPYGLGCGNAGGDWDIVYRIIEETLTDCDVTIYRYGKWAK